LTLRNATRYGETINDYVVTNPGDGTVEMNPADGQYWLQRGLKSRWQKSTILTNVTELSGEANTGSLKHRFNFGIELARETIRNASYNVSTITGRSCPAVFGAGELDCTPYLSPNPNDPWSGTIERAPLSLDAHSTTQAVYLFDTIDLSEA